MLFNVPWNFADVDIKNVMAEKDVHETVVKTNLRYGQGEAKNRLLLWTTKTYWTDESSSNCRKCMLLICYGAKTMAKQKFDPFCMLLSFPVCTKKSMLVLDPLRFCLYLQPSGPKLRPYDNSEFWKSTIEKNEWQLKKPQSQYLIVLLCTPGLVSVVRWQWKSTPNKLSLLEFMFPVMCRIGRCFKTESIFNIGVLLVRLNIAEISLIVLIESVIKQVC